MVKIIPMLLMPISNAASWWFITKSHRGDQASGLLQVVWKVAFFYMLWALYNKYLGGRPQELGHISMGLMAAAAYFQKKYFSMAACGLVVLNFGVVIPLIFSKGPAGLAKMIQKEKTALSMTWAVIFCAYIFSNFALWSFVLYRLYQEVVPGGSGGGRATDVPMYEPIIEQEHRQEEGL
jgi:FtsH-binding integral membrane protein